MPQGLRFYPGVDRTCTRLNEVSGEQLRGADGLADLHKPGVRGGISSIYVLIPLFRAILLMSAGGEMNMIMVAVHEQVPTRHRSGAALLGINFINMRTLISARPNPRPGR